MVVAVAAVAAGPADASDGDDGVHVAAVAAATAPDADGHWHDTTRTMTSAAIKQGSFATAHVRVASLPAQQVLGRVDHCPHPRYPKSL